MTLNLAAQGQQLIQDIEEHIFKALASHPEGESGISVRELQNFSGLTIKGTTGGEVWSMAVITLLIELLKRGRIYSQTSSRNTKDWSENIKVWLP